MHAVSYFFDACALMIGKDMLILSLQLLQRFGRRMVICFICSRRCIFSSVVFGGSILDIDKAKAKQEPRAFKG